MKNALSGLAWVVLYLLFCLAPLVLALGQNTPPGRPFLVEFSVALGFVGLSILVLQFALIARFKVVAAPFGIDALQRYHVQITFVALAFALAHPILLFFADSKYLHLLNPLTAPWRARLAFTGVIALLVLVGLSVWRRALHLSYEWWQATHGLLAVIVVLCALLHASLVGYFVTGLVRHVVYDGYIGVLIFLLEWIRLISPLIRLRRPWRVVRGGRRARRHQHAGDRAGRPSRIPVRPRAVRVDRGGPVAVLHHPAPLLVLLPPADTPPGGPVTMTIKAAGDFTKTVPGVTPGTRVYLDGPHGVFSMDRRQAPGYVFIAGGVGVTPMYSMLLTMREREDVRPVTFFYASATWDDMVFQDELAELSTTMPNLHVVHVLGRPPEGWTGESGRITADVLRRHLPPQYRRYAVLHLRVLRHDGRHGGSADRGGSTVPAGQHRAL